jgi:sigma-B regulation protein RsbU (phosphoserine phosphatase)
MPDLILLDIMMPVMGGVETLKYLKKDDIFRHIPVIMISAVDDIKTTINCIEMGAEDYLPKPFDRVLLMARITSSLEKKLLRDQEQEYIARIIKTQEMLKKELSEAAGYVRSLLPEPLKGNIETDWCFIPSAQLGGDSFGYLWIDEENFVIYLLDVSGHGVGSALLSISIMNLIRSGNLVNADVTDPASVLNALNERFQMETQNNMYFTIWYGVFNKNTRVLRYGSAGHPPAILFFRKKDKESSVLSLRTKGEPIGWSSENRYEMASVTCAKHSTLFIFSDGAYEFVKPNGINMTYAEFTKILERYKNQDEIQVKKIFNDICLKKGSDMFDDDLSIVGVAFS